MGNIKIFGSEFYFARHGQTENNALGLVTGCLDVQLDETGISQARGCAPTVAGLAVRTCVCSPLRRAVQTAEILLSGMTGIETVPVSGLEERSWGKLEGTSKFELDNYVFAEMGVETWMDFTNRTLKALSALDLPGVVFIVAHSGTFRVICEFLDIYYPIKPVKNATPYRFCLSGDRWHVDDVSLTG